MARIQHKSAETNVFMLRQSFQHGASLRKNFCRNKENLCHDITFRIHNKEQQNLCRNKQNIREVNFLSQQEIKEQHKRNGDKEIHAAT